MLDPTNTRQVYKITTLIDITKTNVVRNGNNSKERYQQSNFETLWQVIQLRIQPENIKDPSMRSMNLKQCKFGSKFKGNKNIWVFIFEVDQSDPFGRNFDGLYGDFNGVPFINNLDENVKFTNSVFNCTDEKEKNLCCELVI